MYAKTFSFDRSVQIGAKGEAELDVIFGKSYRIIEARLTEQKRGIDRYFLDFAANRKLSIEYKTDNMSGNTDNVFFELVSVDIRNKPGWLYTCQADILFQYLPRKRVILVWEPKDMRSYVEQQMKYYNMLKTVQNEGYAGVGVCLPYIIAKKGAMEVIKL